MKPEERARQDEIANGFWRRILSATFGLKPQQRLPELTVIREDITATLHGVRKAHRKNETRRALLGFGAVLGATFVAGVFGAAMAASAVPAYITFVAAGGIYAGTTLGFAKRRFKNTYLGLNNALIALKLLSAKRISETVKTHTVEVAPCIQTFMKYPGIYKMFQKAVAKNFPQGPKKPGAEGSSPAP